MVVQNVTHKKSALDVKARVDEATIAVVGLGYVGLPLVQAFSASLSVIGYDIKSKRIAELQSENEKQNLVFTNDAAELERADFIVVCVPTPVTKTKEVRRRCMRAR